VQKKPTYVREGERGEGFCGNYESLRTNATKARWKHLSDRHGRFSKGSDPMRRKIKKDWEGGRQQRQTGFGN